MQEGRLKEQAVQEAQLLKELPEAELLVKEEELLAEEALQEESQHTP